MSPVNHLLAFARTPRLGAVKRRLAADIGPVAALAFYRLTLNRMLTTLARDKRWRFHLAVTPDRDAHAARSWPAGLDRIPQGNGDLGRRMARLMRELAPGPVVIIGTDVPDLRPAHVWAAFKALGSHDAVFGPAPDGGYWLVGLRRRPRRLDIFTGVRFSTAHALDDTLANLGPGHKVAFLEELMDIDDGAALAQWRGK